MYGWMDETSQNVDSKFVSLCCHLVIIYCKKLDVRCHQILQFNVYCDTELPDRIQENVCFHTKKKIIALTP